MTDKIFRVNMTDLTTRIESVPESWAPHGGRGLTSTIVADEVEPTCHPFGPNNSLVFAPGLLSGTPAANSGRISVGAKSPLTGTIKEANKTFAKALVNHPISQGLGQYGTNVLVNIINEPGGLPTKNFTLGQFEGHEKISGETMYDIIQERGGKPKHGCHPGCIIQCSQIYNDSKKQYKTSGFEYESIWAMGADCCVDDLDKIAEADNLMDDLGLDSIETSVAMGADHTMRYSIATNILNVGGSVDPLSKEGQVELSRSLQIATAAVDSTGMCLFIAFAALDDETCLPALIDMLNARFGLELNGDDVIGLGKNILKTEKAFNDSAGFTREHDRLPEFFTLEKLPPHNVVWDFAGDEIDSFWDF